jgi:hypothetical protein
MAPSEFERFVERLVPLPDSTTVRRAAAGRRNVERVRGAIRIVYRSVPGLEHIRGAAPGQAPARQRAPRP